MTQELFDFTKPGYYGQYGGAFVPEILRATLDELIATFDAARADDQFWGAYVRELQTYSCRPTPVTPLPNLTKKLGGATICCKREDLNHTGAHKVNNVIGQGLLAKRMNKTRVIAETGAGQHGVATATMAARFGFECTIYMGAVDVRRQRPNVFWMEQLGATVVPIEDGSATLKDAINACLRDWSESMDSTHYVLGTACGPHPFPHMVSYFQSIIGQEARGQMLTQSGRLPDRVYACVGGGSNALGMFVPFIKNPEVELVGVEAGGHGIESGRHAARIPAHDIGVAQGYKTLFLQDDEGQMRETHSVAAGLDYIGVSPILAHLADTGRVRFTAARDDEAIAAAKLLIATEGIIPALESSHAFAGAIREAPSMRPDEIILINLSGRGDKDIFTIADAIGDERWFSYLREMGARR